MSELAECPMCLRPLPPVIGGQPRTETEAFLLSLVSSGYASARELAVRLFGSDASRAEVERVRRRLESARRAGLLLRDPRPGPGGTAAYRPRA